MQCQQQTRDAVQPKASQHHLIPQSSFPTCYSPAERRTGSASPHCSPGGFHEHFIHPALCFHPKIHRLVHCPQRFTHPRRSLRHPHPTHLRPRRHPHLRLGDDPQRHHRLRL